MEKAFEFNFESLAQIFHRDLEQTKVQDRNIQAALKLFPHSKLLEPMDELDMPKTERCTHDPIMDLTRSDFEYLTSIDARRISNAELELMASEYLDYCVQCGYHLKSEGLEIVDDSKGDPCCTNCLLPF